MKKIISIFLILLGTNSIAQQNYFSKRYSFGCGQNGFKIIQNGFNYDGIASVGCIGLSLKSVFYRIDSTGNLILERIHGVDYTNYFSGGYGAFIILEDSSYLYAGGINDTLNNDNALLYHLSKDGDSLWIKEYGDSLFQSGWQSPCIQM